MMRSQHLTEEQLVAIAADPSSVTGSEQHLSECSDCRAGVAFYRAQDGALKHADTWSAEKEFADDLAALVGYRDRIAHEDEEAERLLAPISGSPKLFTAHNILKRPQFHSGGVVRALCKLVRVWCGKDPLYAMQLADAAQAIAGSLPEDYYPSHLVYELRGLAWKEYAVACRWVSDFRGGLKALDSAESAYRKLPDPDARLAAVNLARAIILQWRQQYGEALPLARAAVDQYELSREEAKYLEAKEVEAQILHRLGDVDAACKTYRIVYAAADGIGDIEMKARCSKNLGIASMERGRFDEADKYLHTALGIYEVLGKDATVLRTKWTIACLTRSVGRLHEAVAQLRMIRAEFEAKGMLDEAQEAGLDLVEALQALGQNDEVVAICAAVFDYYRNQNVITGALAAAAYLKDAASAMPPRLTQRDVERVRKFLADVRINPTLLFEPPPGA